MIVDGNYNPIGIEDRGETSPGGGVFIPPYVFGKDPYSIGDRPSNRGAGGGQGPGELDDPAMKVAINQIQNMRRSNISVGKVPSKIKTSSFLKKVGI